MEWKQKIRGYTDKIKQTHPIIGIIILCSSRDAWFSALTAARAARKVTVTRIIVVIYRCRRSNRRIENYEVFEGVTNM
jgi:hypothetical protein